MAHNNYIKPGGIWPLFTLLTSGIMATVDALLYKALNADDGGTWSPSAVITLGGAGLTVTGPFTANNASITIGSGKTLTIASGGTFITALGSTTTLNGDGTLSGSLAVDGDITIQSGGLIDVEVGGAIDLSGGLTLFGEIIAKTGSLIVLEAGSELFSSADFWFSNSTNPKFQPARSWGRESLRVAHTTYTTGSGPTNPIVWQAQSGGSGQNANALQTADLDRLAEFWIQFDALPPNGELTQVEITTRGLMSANGMVLPKYRIIRWRGNGTPSNLSVLTDDDHTDWANFVAANVTTTIAVSGGTHTVDSSYNYGLLVQCAYYSIATGSALYLACKASGTLEEWGV